MYLQSQFQTRADSEEADKSSPTQLGLTIVLSTIFGVLLILAMWALYIGIRKRMTRTTDLEQGSFENTHIASLRSWRRPHVQPTTTGAKNSQTGTFVNPSNLATPQPTLQPARPRLWNGRPMLYYTNRRQYYAEQEASQRAEQRAEQRATNRAPICASNPYLGTSNPFIQPANSYVRPQAQQMSERGRSGVPGAPGVYA
ncbi:hypothetical protein M011DRAFT_460942 [Sporormia fimetaria CBS 119925]|uniref:Uncharacterized protein n=1 Tax=Sporormia fimetaria CBS 119925 TaxID=1340428 RepID=A0A6A6V3G5_9PLEO|nr:hypothetical protein M011DRAFT_460942 [Sporormia fimetaria CBS 119925]